VSYLLDTNILSEAMRMSPEPLVLDWLEEFANDSFVSAIVVAEIEQGIVILQDGKKKRHLEKAFTVLMETLEGRLLAFDENVARRWATLTGAFHRKGHPLPILDSMIEATALHWQLTVVTRNTGDFVEAKTLDPWKTA
jgi:toxin FitB